MEPTIYKPSIYNGTGIYKTGAEGGGGGQTGVIYYFDFLDYPETLAAPYLVPKIGEKYFLNLSGFSNLTIDSNGLNLNANINKNDCNSFNLFGFGGGKLRFSQKTNFISSYSSNWSQFGFILLGLVNYVYSDRGMGICIPNDVFDSGEILNSFVDGWEFSDSINGGFHFLYPPVRLSPGSSCENFYEFDFDKKSIRCNVNGVDCFYSENVASDTFYRAIGFFHVWFTVYTGCKLAIEYLKIESFE